MILIDFNLNSNTSNWYIVNDVVMGGKSNSSLSSDEYGYGVFSGKVSLENNGGFSMVQYKFEPKNIKKFTKVCMRLKGDGKPYQFRIKRDISDKHSYVIPFVTSGEWETIEIPLNAMQPTFRGRKLNMPNYQSDQMEMIAFLIGNKKAESFMLTIDFIMLN